MSPTRCFLCLAAGALLAATAPAARAAIDLNALWDFGNPVLSEQRFRAALPGAGADDALILQTQIARTLGLRRQFDAARATLAAIEPQLATAGPEARVRFWLERGRTQSSGTHPPESQTDAARAAARADYLAALAAAREARLDGLAVDAVHMLAFVDTAPADQLKWAQTAMAIVSSSQQAEALRWRASIHHNLGYALQRLGRLDEALAEFEAALRLREQAGQGPRAHVARFMVARVLRLQGRNDEALALQQRLQRDAEAVGQPDRYVLEELELLHRQRGDATLAEQMARQRLALQPPP